MSFLACTHHWSVTSECPMCLRSLLNRALVELAKQIFSSHVVYDREICDMAEAKQAKEQKEYERRLASRGRT